MIMKYLSLICFFILSQSKAQLAVQIEGSAGVDFYVGQTLTIQAEGNVSVSSGAEIRFENGGTPDFRLKGDFTNDPAGIYTLGTEKVRFNGSALQSADFGGDDVYGIYTENSNNVQVTSHVNVTGDLEFATGDVVSTGGALITLGTAATVTGADNDSHNNGPIAKNFNSTSNFELPTGDGTSYNPLSFEPDGTGATTMQAQYFATSVGDITPGAGLNNVSNLEFWNLTRSSGSENGDVTLAWDASSNVGTHTELVVSYWGGSNWTNGGGATHTGNATAGTVKSSSISSFGVNFALASTTVNNALPVELINFNAVINQEDHVDLNWTTASEINSDFFHVMRSTDGINYDIVATENAAGHSTDFINYSITDYNPSNGLNYYKLVNYDFDGSFEESEIKVVVIGGTESTFAYPNPASDMVRFSHSVTKIEIYNSMGQLLVSDENVTQVNTSFLAPGTYFMMFNGEAPQELVIK